MTATSTIDDVAAELTRLLGSECVSTDVQARRTASRDYAWLSPILTEELPDTFADIVVTPRSATDLPVVLDVAHRHRVHVTPRGRGTGNYGQAVPLRQGVVVDMTRCTEIRDISGGVAEVEAGVSFLQIEAAAATCGLEVAVMPSMTASTIGGFLAGGNQGIGSIENGSIWDGWVESLEIVPCRDGAAPFLAEGDEVGGHLHSYGTAGIIASARVRLTPLRRRTVLFAAFDRFADAAYAGRSLMDLDPAPRVLSIDDPAITPSMPRHDGLVEGKVMLRTGIEIGTVDAASEIVADHGGVVTAVDPTAMNALVASSYNHATLRSKRLDPRTCALQVRGWALVEHEAEVHSVLPDARLHLDGNAPRVHGKGYSGLLLSSWVDRETLAAGMQRLRDLGISVISPHTWRLGGHGNVDRVRAAAESVDPDALLNPGKLPQRSGHA